MDRLYASINARVGAISRLIWAESTPFVRRRAAAVLILVLAAAGLAPLGPVALKLIVDSFADDTLHVATIAVPVVLYAMSQWLSRSIGEVRGLIYARAERRMFTRISDRVFAHVMQLPLRFHLQRSTGAINQTLENGLQGFQLIVHHLIFTALPVLVQLITTAWIIHRIDQPLFLAIFCAAVVCYAVAFSVFVLRVTQAAQEASAAHVAANAKMTDNILNYETVKFFAAEEFVRARVREALSETEDRWVRFYRGYAVNGLVVATIFAAFLTTAIALAAREVAAKHMTIGEFVLINTYMLQLMQPVEMLGYAVQGLSQGGAMLERMMALLKEIPELARPERAAATESPAALPQSGRASRAGSGLRSATPASLEFRNVTLSYQPGRPVVRNVSFFLPAGKTLAVVGSSGSGKSTLVRALVRLLDAESGEVLLDGVRTSDIPLSELRRSIAVVPQDTVLFNDTIRYNIGFGRLGCGQDEIERAAKLAHLHDCIDRHDALYDALVGERGVKLSGGERQRISIARAALKEPRLYVFDEATSSLDSATEREIMKNLRDIARESTTVIIAHRLSTVVHADEIIVLNDGALAERGTHADLLKQRGVYESLWLAQQTQTAAARVG